MNKEKFKLCYSIYEKATWRNTGESEKATYAIEKEEDTLFVLFQSTWTKKDIAMDLMFFPLRVKPYEDSSITFRVHRGFWKQFDGVRQEILEEVKLANVSKVYVYGWSLGGAHALFCKEMLERNTFQNLECITIGAPRCFYVGLSNKNIKDMLNNTTCYHNGNDIVPFIPLGFSNIVERVHVGGGLNLKKLFSGLDHLNTEYYISITGEEYERI